MKISEKNEFQKFRGTVSFAELASANTVGYATKNCPANKFMHAAAQFEDVTSGKLFLDSVMSGLEGVDYDDAGAFEGTAPHIQVVKADGTPDMYYYLNDGWYDNGTTDGGFKAGWCDNLGNIADVNIAAQAGFWVKATTGALTFTYKK